MFFVDLPKPGSYQMETLAQFSCKAEALAWANKNLGADRDGNINVISDDGDNEMIFQRIYSDDEYEIIVSARSDYELSIVFYNETRNLKFALNASYSQADDSWNIVGYPQFAKDIDQLINLGIKIANQAVAK